MATDNRTRRRAKLPPGVTRRPDGRFLASIRLKGFAPALKVFADADAAVAWAEATRNELTTQRARGAARRDLATLTVGDLIREHLADPATAALRSYESTHDRLDWWVANSGATRVIDFGVVAIRDARAKLMNKNHWSGERKVAAATVNRYLAAMRHAWAWGKNVGLVPIDRAWPTGLMLKEPPGRVRFLTDDELKRLMTAARRRGPVEAAMITVSIATGMRRGELLRLTWADVDLDRATVRILKTKNGRPRVGYLPPAAVESLRGLRKASVVSPTAVFLNPDGEPYRESTFNWFKVVRREAKLKDFRWHDLRHTTASYLGQNRATLLEIGSVLGHLSPASTARYTHLVEGRAVTGHTALDEKLRGS